MDEPAGVNFQSFLGRVEYKSFYAGFNFYDEGGVIVSPVTMCLGEDR